MDESARRLRRIGGIKRIVLDACEIKISISNLTLAGSEFPSVGSAILKIKKCGRQSCVYNVMELFSQLYFVPFFHICLSIKSVFSCITEV